MSMVTAKSAESAKQQQPQEPQTLKLRSALLIFSLEISTLQEAQKRKSPNAPTHFAGSKNSSRFSELQEAQKRKFFSLKGRLPPQKRGGTPIPGVLCWDDG